MLPEFKIKIDNSTYSSDETEIWRIDDNGEETLYMQRGQPVMYPKGMWVDMQLLGLEHPGMQELIDHTVLLYNLLRKDHG
jgi:hypothetical protein